MTIYLSDLSAHEKAALLWAAGRNDVAPSQSAVGRLARLGLVTMDHAEEAYAEAESAVACGDVNFRALPPDWIVAITKAGRKLAAVSL
jgi:hypothetical protein